MKLDHHLIPHTRINSKWSKDLNVTPETIKIVEENISGKILDIAHNNFYWIYLHRQGKQKKKRNKWDYIKLKCFCRAEEIINKIKIHPTEWENIFADTSDKGLMSKIYKVLSKFNTPKTTQLKNKQRNR